ncbi:hypothetical protein F5Y19DRAFT_488523 [Xylariaceae sp. FL1651]|nr:hypothetical protein F5Y19DRAFT_488523 [Xylariaceae sp. FL1651]
MSNRSNLAENSMSSDRIPPIPPRNPSRTPSTRPRPQAKELPITNAANSVGKSAQDLPLSTTHTQPLDNRPWQRPGETDQRPMNINTNISQSRSDLDPCNSQDSDPYFDHRTAKTRAPFVSDEAFIPRPAPTSEHGLGAHPLNMRQHIDSHSTISPSTRGELSRSDAIRIARSASAPAMNKPLPKLPLQQPAMAGKTMTSFTQAPFDYHSPTSVSKNDLRNMQQETTVNSRTSLSKRFEGLGKFLRRARSNSSGSTNNSNNRPKKKLLTLAADKYGQVPLLTLNQKRNLALSEPLKSEPLTQAYTTLQHFRDAFTRELPTLALLLGQEQINAVVEYLKKPCSIDMEASETTELARYSPDSLAAMSLLRFPRKSADQSDRARVRRWNMVEARRRVRHHNTVKEDFHSAWDNWVSVQTPVIQKAARRAGGQEEIMSGTRSPFHDYYYYVMIAAEGEIRQRQDIGEALILQYPTSFPGFMAEELAEGGR